MAVVMLAVGSRGDVAPMAALAGGLQRAGAEATLIATREFAPWSVLPAVALPPCRRTAPVRSS